MQKRKPTTAPPPKPSFRDLVPLEHGGPVARRGFAYQDHVAAGKCLDMLLPDGPAEVWCEAEDDVVLVWASPAGDLFEFVQVKSDALDQLWSVAALCRPGPAGADGTPGRCIVEKSLAHDRGREPCRFRLVTIREPNAELAALKLGLGDPARVRTDSGLESAVAAVVARVSTFRSDNGNGADHWVRHAVWECWATVGHAESDNLCKLDRVLHAENAHLAPDQKQELYAKLVRRVFDASTACGRTAPAAKRLTAADCRGWLIRHAGDLARPATPGRSDTLERKLAAAGFDPAGDEVAAAKEQRRAYRRAVLDPGYLDLGDREVMETEVQAALCELKAGLDAGRYADAGVEFHARCLSELGRLRDTLPTKRRPLLGQMQGCMYDVMNRCLHRLVRAS